MAGGLEQESEMGWETAVTCAFLKLSRKKLYDVGPLKQLHIAVGSVTLAGIVDNHQ